MKRTRGKDIESPARRRSLQAAALAMLSGAGLPGPAAIAAADTRQRTREIPSSGEAIPIMGLGTYRTFDVPMSATAELEALREVTQRFVERGGEMIDSSPMYGRAEAVTGRLVSALGAGDDVFYATKVWTRGQEAGMAQMDESFDKMRTGFIHLMQVHNLTDTATQIRSIRKLQDEGRVKYLGITHYTTGAFDELEAWMKKEKIDYIQFPYSIANRVAEDRLIPAARDLGVATIAHKNFERGSLFRRVGGGALPEWASELDCDTWGNFFLKYLMAEPGITNLIPATSDPEHLDDNMNAGLGRLPDRSMRARMVDYMERL